MFEINIDEIAWLSFSESYTFNVFMRSVGPINYIRDKVNFRANKAGGKNRF